MYDGSCFSRSPLSLPCSLDVEGAPRAGRFPWKLVSGKWQMRPEQEEWRSRGEEMRGGTKGRIRSRLNHLDVTIFLSARRSRLQSHAKLPLLLLVSTNNYSKIAVAARSTGKPPFHSPSTALPPFICISTGTTRPILGNRCNPARPLAFRAAQDSPLPAGVCKAVEGCRFRSA